LYLSGEDAKQRGLSNAIIPYQGEFFSLRDAERYVFKKPAVVIRF
jgi:hypothetical protein